MGKDIDENPYEAPESNLNVADSAFEGYSEEEKYRLRLLQRERDSRAVGAISVGIGIILLLICIVSIIESVLSVWRVTSLALAFIPGLHGLGFLGGGILLRRFNPIGRILLTGLHALGLLPTLIMLQEDVVITPIFLLSGLALPCASVLIIASLWMPGSKKLYSIYYSTKVLVNTRHIHAGTSHLFYSVPLLYILAGYFLFAPPPPP